MNRFRSESVDSTIRPAEKSPAMDAGLSFTKERNVRQCTIMPVKTYACSMTSTPTRQASAIECLNTNRRIVPSCPNQLVAVEATTIDCASIILPMTPPEELAAAIRIGDRPNCWDVIFCKFPNRMFDAVSEPVSATPNQPSNVPKNG